MNKKQIGSVLLYALSIGLFVLLTFSFDRVRITTESPLSDSDDPNTQWVLDEIENNPLRGQGELSVCAAVPETAERTQVGFPFALYETAKTTPCGLASGRTNQVGRNQLLNTATAAIIATTVGFSPAIVNKLRR